MEPAKNPTEPIPTYAEVFGGTIVEDIVYDTDGGFARIWTVETDKGVDRVHFVSSDETHETHFVVESSRKFLKYAPCIEDLGHSATRDYFSPPGRCNPCIQRLLTEGWHLLAIRTLDKRTSVSNHGEIRHLTAAEPSKIFMLRSWILAHPLRQIMVNLRVSVKAHTRREVDDLGCIPLLGVVWEFELVRDDLAFGYNPLPSWTKRAALRHENAIPETIRYYGTSHYFKPPDDEFARGLHHATARVLPFTNLWYLEFCLATRFFPRDSIEPALAEELIKRGAPRTEVAMKTLGITTT